MNNRIEDKDLDFNKLTFCRRVKSLLKIYRNFLTTETRPIPYQTKEETKRVKTFHFSKGKYNVNKKCSQTKFHTAQKTCGTNSPLLTLST